MTQKIFDIKKKIIDEFGAEIDRVGSVSEMDTHEVGMIADMIKDLAEAEEKCWEACYYKTVVEAMTEESGRGPMGYIPSNMGRLAYDGNAMGYQGAMGYHGEGMAPMGYREAMGYNGSMGYNGRMGTMNGRGGYSDQSVQNIRHIMEAADPQRREQLKQDLRKLMSEVDV